MDTEQPQENTDWNKQIQQKVYLGSPKSKQRQKMEVTGIQIRCSKGFFPLNSNSVHLACLLSISPDLQLPANLHIITLPFMGYAIMQYSKKLISITAQNPDIVVLRHLEYSDFYKALYIRVILVSPSILCFVANVTLGDNFRVTLT